jgi:hypothetical protein
MSDRPYPGSKATVEQIIDLAEWYKSAAESLFKGGKKGQVLSKAPARLCSIHAIEPYLNAFLLSKGETR